jgi:hypothetical protein
MPRLGQGGAVGGAAQGGGRNLIGVGVAGGLARHHAQAEALDRVVGGALQPSVVEDQGFALGLFQKQLAVIGPGPCILNVDPATLGLTQPRPTRAQLTTMVMCALECAQDSDALRLLPPVFEGVAAVHIVAVYFFWSMESPFPAYRFITNPLNVSGTRSVEALEQQLPLIKLLCIAHRAIPRSSGLWCDPWP